MEIKIYYQDTDCGGVVYYANYLTYFERARTEWFAENGVNIKEYAVRGIHFVVRHAEAEFISPAVYGDTIVVHTHFESNAGVRMVLSYKIEEKISKRLLVTGKTTLVCVDDNFKPRRISEEIISKIKL
ncbi:MAG: YbgC/FadM family acyl-CoA thioesterase [Elusimicrobiota bacterium]